MVIFISFTGEIALSYVIRLSNNEPTSHRVAHPTQGGEATSRFEVKREKIKSRGARASLGNDGPLDEVATSPYLIITPHKTMRTPY